MWADGVTWTCWGRGKDCRCHEGRVEDIPHDGWVERRLAADNAVVFQPSGIGPVEEKGQDPPYLGVPALDADEHKPAEGPLGWGIDLPHPCG